MLSQAAFNAFLKTLEEPPQHAIFILATTEKHKIIPTILSRCQIYDFQRIRIEDTVGYLKSIASREGVTFDDESLHLIARKADGGMRDALSMFDKAVSFCGGNLEYKEVAATLNVLDYDTYFSLTHSLIEGDYKQALNIFDDVLKKGFSGQTFAAGLASHMRDLLMCKDPQTLPLLEITGSLLDRYKQQSAECSASFLFNAISQLGAVDGGFRTATNQRLHVELGLMRLANMGEKKTFDVIAPALPPLQKESTPVAQQANNQTVAPQAAATPQAAPVSQREVPVAPATQTATHSAPAPRPNPAPQAKTPASEATKRIFGGSISDIMSGRAAASEDEEKSIYYDPQSGAKITKHWGEFMERLMKEHPRLGHALKETKVSGHTLSLAVPTDIIRDEVLRNQPEITALLQECCGIGGSIVLNVEVKAQEDNTLPHRTIDKVRYLTEKNPELSTLIQDLGLDVQ